MSLVLFTVLPFMAFSGLYYLMGNYYEVMTSIIFIVFDKSVMYLYPNTSFLPSSIIPPLLTAQIMTHNAYYIHSILHDHKASFTTKAHHFITLYGSYYSYIKGYAHVQLALFNIMSYSTLMLDIYKLTVQRKFSQKIQYGSFAVFVVLFVYFRIYIFGHIILDIINQGYQNGYQNEPGVYFLIALYGLNCYWTYVIYTKIQRLFTKKIT